jgi:hypothetical protein
MPIEKMRIAERTMANFMALLMQGIIGHGSKIPKSSLQKNAN